MGERVFSRSPIRAECSLIKKKLCCIKDMWIDFKISKRKSILIDSGHEKGSKTINLQ